MEIIKFIPGSRLYPDIKHTYNQRMSEMFASDETQEHVWTAAAERALCKHTGRKYALLCTSGTSAIQLMLMAHNIGPGDEVICTNYSCPATVMPICVLGATPVFVDIDVHGQPNYQDVENNITSRTKAILATGLYGDTFDYDKIKDLGLPILNDSAQSWLGLYKGVDSVTLGDMSILSFSGNKNCPVFGTYGAVLTDNEQLYHKTLLQRRNGYMHRDLGIEHIGINSQPHEDKAIQVLCSLERLDTWQTRRHCIADYYREHLSNLRTSPVYSKTSDHKTVLFVENNVEFRDKMRAQGIDCRLHYTYNFGATPQLAPPKGSYPITEWYGKHTVSIPGNQFMTDAEVESVVQAVKKIVTKEDYKIWPNY